MGKILAVGLVMILGLSAYADSGAEANLLRVSSRYGERMRLRQAGVMREVREAKQYQLLPLPVGVLPQRTVKGTFKTFSWGALGGGAVVALATAHPRVRHSQAFMDHITLIGRNLSFSGNVSRGDTVKKEAIIPAGSLITGAAIGAMGATVGYLVVGNRSDRRASRVCVSALSSAVIWALGSAIQGRSWGAVAAGAIAGLVAGAASSLVANFFVSPRNN